ncbi:hypothetical protein RTM1035_10510 [Roseovarius sp. TM1035]|nr:hypothetical protein RTM1035_10510 [Roseovarius sp. TM1035]
MQSAAVIHAEFDRVRCVLVFVDFVHLERDVGLDLVFGEHVACQQEIVISGQTIQCFAQRATDGRDVFQLFGGQVIKVLVHGFAGINLGFDTVEASHEQSGKRQIGVCARIRETGLYALGLGAFGPRNTDATRTVAGRIGAQNGGLETGDQPLVAVGAGVGEGVQRLGMLENATDEIQRLLAEVGIFVTGKKRLAVFPDRHVHMHARPVVAIDRLGHEGGGFAIGMRHVVNDVFVFLNLVGLLGQRAENQTQFVLAACDFMVVFIHLHADPLHGREHFGAQVLGVVDRVYREIPALEARTMAGVAHLVFGVTVPRRVNSVYLIRDFVDGVREAHVVKDEEFSFGAKIGHIADTGRLEICLGFFCRAARIAIVGFAGVGFNNRAMDAKCLFRVERIDICTLGVGHQLHVGSLDRLPARDRRSVEHKAFFEEILIDQVRDHGHMLKFTAHVGEPDIDVVNILILDQLENCVFAHSLVLFLLG